MILWGMAGCRHLPAPPSDKGQSSFRFIEPKRDGSPPPLPDASAAIQQVGGVLLPPQVLPLYPAVALAHHAGRSIFGVRITISPEGRVSDIASSPLIVSTPGPYADAFRAAVEAAVVQWRFDPVQRLHLEHVSDADSSNHQGYWRLAQRETVEAQADVMFTFDSGKVFSGPADLEMLHSK
jgi:hypothetical protein